MRREGFELSVCRPKVLFKMVEGQKHEPIEHLFIDVAEEYQGVVLKELQSRRGVMTNMTNNGDGRIRLELSIPTRSLIGYRG